MKTKYKKQPSLDEGNTPAKEDNTLAHLKKITINAINSVSKAECMLFWEFLRGQRTTIKGTIGFRNSCVDEQNC